MAAETQTSPRITEFSNHSSLPRDPFEEQLVAIWRDILDVPSVGIHDDFFALGGTSLESTLVVKRIQRTFERELPVNILFEAPSIEQLAKLLRNDPTARPPAVIAWRERGSVPPLFCLPGAAGDLVTLRDLWLQLPDNQPIYGIDYPFPFGNAGIATVDEIAESQLKYILETQPKGPFFVIGLCFGGLVAFEIARLLAARGETVAFLGLLDPPLPGLRDRPITLARVRTFASRIARGGRRGWAESLRNFSGRLRWKASAHWNALLASGLPVLASASRLDRTSLNVHAAMQYRPAAFPGPLTVFVTDAGGASYNRYAEGEWAKLGTNLDLIEVRGNHRDFIHAPHVEELAASLLKHLRRAQEQYRPVAKRKPA
jgi:thioesterase domain-containing protein